MKQFYETYITSKMGPAPMAPSETPPHQVNPIVSSAMTQLENRGNTLLTHHSWTHHLVLLARTKSEEARAYYLRLCLQEKYSVRELERQINSGVFERVMLGSQHTPPAIQELKQDLSHIFKDSYVFEFLNIPEPHS